VGETDWRAELEAFGKGVREDASEVQKHAQKAARDGASKLEQLPQQAANARLPHVDPNKVKTHLDQVRLSDCPKYFPSTFLLGCRTVEPAE
jgi:hypothetical protein